MRGLQREDTPTGGRVQFPATLDHVEDAVRALHSYLGDASECVKCFEFGLLCFEALSNAVRHGCGDDPARQVAATVDVTGDTVALTVTDDGPGFDWRAHPAVAPGDHATGGRGLLILREYADQVRFNEAGNQVTIVKRIRLAAESAE